MMDPVRQDVRFALRSLARRPLFATIAVVTLALGIGGTTAIFSVVDGVLIKDLPYRDPSSLVSVWRAWPSWRGRGLLDDQWDHIYFPSSDYLNVRDYAGTLSDVEAYRALHVTLTGGGRAEEVSVGRVTDGLFELLGVQPVLGRAFVEEETLPAAARGARVAVLSNEFWVSRFGSDPGVLGRTIVMNEEGYEVVGVLPPRFRLVSDELTTGENGGAQDAGLRDVWVPLGRAEADCGNCLELLARLVPGRSLDEARAEVQRLLIDHPGDPPGQIARVVPHKERLTQRFGTPLLVLFGAAGVLLLIACLNVAGLLVGEATTRHQEIAVRSALGAGRGRVARQLLTESVLLGVIGAAAGVIVAWLGTDALLSVAPPMPRLEELGVRGRVLAFAVATGVATGLLFGLAPTLSLIGPRAVFRSRGASRGKGTRSLQTGVVSVQVGLTVMLLVAGGLFGRSLTRLLSVDPGFVPEGLLTLAFSVPPARAGSTEEIARFQAEVVRTAGTVAGVSAVSATTEVPFPGGDGARSFTLEPDGAPVAVAMWHRSVLPNYHATMGIPLLAGRLLSAADGPGAPDVIVVSRSFAEQIWPGESPLGKRIYNTGPSGAWTVVGVVGDVRHKTLGAPAEPTIYRTTAQAQSRRLHLVARTEGDPAAAIPAIQQAIRALDPDTPLTDAGTMSTLMRESEADDRFRAILMWTFAALAALLASFGIFGVTARAVSARAREIGIRTALGARANGLILLVLRDGLFSATAGIGIGLIGATWTAGVVRHLLYDLDARDPLTYAAVVVFAVALCLVAAYLPARRVTSISPMEVMADD
jgi:putative ABC transport system permease protein